MISEFAIGRASQLSPVDAFRKLTSRKNPWQSVGRLGVFQMIRVNLIQVFA